MRETVFLCLLAKAARVQAFRSKAISLLQMRQRWDSPDGWVAIKCSSRSFQDAWPLKIWDDTWKLTMRTTLRKCTDAQYAERHFLILVPCRSTWSCIRAKSPIFAQFVERGSGRAALCIFTSASTRDTSHSNVRNARSILSPEVSWCDPSPQSKWYYKGLIFKACLRCTWESTPMKGRLSVIPAVWLFGSPTT